MEHGVCTFVIIYLALLRWKGNSGRWEASVSSLLMFPAVQEGASKWNVVNKSRRGSGPSAYPCRPRVFVILRGSRFNIEPSTSSVHNAKRDS